MDLTEEIRKIAEGIPAIETKTVEAGYRFVYSLY